MPIAEYEPGAAFPGVVGRTADESVPAWPAPVRAGKGAPNVLFIVLDDTGFGQLGCYGSPITLRFEFEPTGKPDMQLGRGAPGRLQLYVDGALAANAEAPVTTPFVLNPGAPTCGANPGSPVTDDYPSPFTFTGTIHSVTVDVSGELIHDTEAELRMHMARQ